MTEADDFVSSGAKRTSGAAEASKRLRCKERGADDDGSTESRNDDEDDRQHDSMPSLTLTMRRKSRSSGEPTDTVSKRWIDRRLTMAKVELDRM